MRRPPIGGGRFHGTLWKETDGMRETGHHESLWQRFDRWYDDDSSRVNLHIAFSSLLAIGLFVLFALMMD
jgi:hypothetical protein